MLGLKRITGILLILYACFLFLNSFELYNRLIAILFQNQNGLSYNYPELKSIHHWLDLLAAMFLLVFLFMLNQFLFKQYAVKRVHWALLLLSFVPLVHYFIYFPILRRINRTLFLKKNKDSKTTDLLLFSTWMIMLGLFCLGLLFGLFVHLGFKGGTIKNPNLIYSMFNIYSNNVAKLLVSVTMGFYFWHLIRCLKSQEETQNVLRDDALLD